MVDFAQLKANRSKSVETLQKELESLDKGKVKFIDENEGNYWNPQLDKAGLCLAEIRFLPSNEDEGQNIIKLENWAFKGPGGWYINDSRRNIGEDDPAQRYNNLEWFRAKNDGKARPNSLMKKNKFYLANVYIITDKNNPENEGQVKIWRFGQKVFDKIKKAMFPDFESDAPINVFDFWEGANFKVKLSLKKAVFDGKEQEFRNYDDCSFGNPSEFMKGDEEKIQKIWSAQHSLKQFLDPSKYKSYDDLADRLAKALEIDKSCLYDSKELSKEDKAKAPKEFLQDDIPSFDTPKGKSLEAKKESESAPWEGDEEEDDFFKSLAEE